MVKRSSFGLAFAAAVLAIPLSAADAHAQRRHVRTSRIVEPGSSSRATTVERRNGVTATGSRQVVRDGDGVIVDRQAQSSTGRSIDRHKEYEIENGRVESVERSVSGTDRYGRTAYWNGEAERRGVAWKFEGMGSNRVGQTVDADGRVVRGLPWR